MVFSLDHFMRLTGMVCLAFLQASGSDLNSARTATEIPFQDVRDEKGRTASDIALELRQSSEAAAKKQAAQVEAREEELRSIRIPLEREECLAYHRGERRCLVTSGELNARLAENPDASDGTGIHTGNPEARLAARTSALDVLLHERFIQAMADRIDQGDLRGVGIEAWQAHLNESTAAVGEARLRRLYRKHYRNLFAPKKSATVWMMGSSDSSFVDSLAKASLQSDMGTANQTRPQKKGSTKGRSFRWQKISSQEVPRELSRVVDTTGEGTLSQTIRCRFGWSVVLVTKVDRVPEIPYSDALPLLLELAAIDDLNGPSRKAVNPKPRSMEDLAFKAWLLPQSTIPKGLRVSKPDWTDTNRVSGLLLRLEDLPMNPGIEFLGILMRNRSSFLQNKYGTWYFRVPEGVSRNHDMLSASLSYQENQRQAMEEESVYGLRQAIFDAKAKEMEFKSHLAAVHLAKQSLKPENADGGSAFDAAFKLWKTEDVFVESRHLQR